MNPSSDAPVHFTDLKKIAISPAHYLAGLTTPKDTPAMRLGRLVHTIVLGGPPSAVWDGTRRGKEWEAFKAANEGREIVTVDEVTKATAIANAAMRCPLATPYLNGEHERPVEWEFLGRKCATRGIDVLGDVFLTDLKTSTSTHPDRFRRQCLSMGYHAQLAFYHEAAASIGRPVRGAYIVGVEVAPPYAVTVFRVTPSALEEGRKLLRLWMERLLACEASNEWPAYAQTVLDLDVSEDSGIIIDGDEDEVIAA